MRSQESAGWWRRVSGSQDGENMLAGEHEFNLLEMLLMKLCSVRNKSSSKPMPVLNKQNNFVSVECVNQFSSYASLNTRNQFFEGNFLLFFFVF